jgi:phosphoribosylformylglycinamidine synthase
MGTVTTSDLDLYTKLDIAKYRDIWFKTPFIRLKQSKNRKEQARFDNYKTKH